MPLPRHPFRPANAQTYICALSMVSRPRTCCRRAVASVHDHDHDHDDSYSYMEHIVSKWDELGVLKRVLEKKLIFIETKVSSVHCRRL